MHSLEEAHERAALYAAGALSSDEQREFEAHLSSGCPLCRAEYEAFARVGARLGEVPERRQPRPELRQAVLAALDRVAADAAITEVDGIRFVRTRQMAWETVGGALRLKRLDRDSERARHSVLIRLEPGQAYPRHRHADVEEVYLLEGDLTINGVAMRAGDYCRAEPGSIHHSISTVGGCMFVVFASEHDEILL